MRQEKLDHGASPHSFQASGSCQVFEIRESPPHEYTPFPAVPLCNGFWDSEKLEALSLRGSGKENISDLSSSNIDGGI